MELDAFHDNFENLIEFVGGEAFDILSASIEVAPHVGEDGYYMTSKISVYLLLSNLSITGRNGVVYSGPRLISMMLSNADNWSGVSP